MTSSSNKYNKSNNVRIIIETFDFVDLEFTYKLISCLSRSLDLLRTNQTTGAENLM